MWENNPLYWIYYGDKFQYHVKSEKLGSNAACLYAKSSFEIFEQTRNIHQQETVLKSSDNLT
ncbi:hypothetical protein RhiirA1_481379 [Rhizophagus irregularis]|uniref:Uncharacterized protein n=1 Tax=Rhizophagus irregularis TaxID=588596 RepID=A0A2N0QN55_9GLOM|nr:hypothetical protein RhiirA1_481379 [Rhizophagus irregularis]GET64487.1 hypothetical protein GLOIN_2v1792490 [Rhizophagus irregularis DAOM 181602=DAOM 197198]